MTAPGECAGRSVIDRVRELLDDTVRVILAEGAASSAVTRGRAGALADVLALLTSGGAYDWDDAGECAAARQGQLALSQNRVLS